jgi:hypothetical protein
MSNLLFRRPSVGKEINAYCGRCKDERTHIVSAMDGDIVRRVTCSTCGSIHNFKAKPEPKQARSSSLRTTKQTGKPPGFKIDPRGRSVKAYDMQAFFSAGDVIDHPKFGLGEVQNSLAPNKIEVRFEEGSKLLLHNMKSVG